MADLYEMSTGNLIEFLRVMRDAGLTDKLAEKIKDNPRLAARMVRAVEVRPRQASPKPSIHWTAVDEYVDRIMARSQMRGWGFTPADAKRLEDMMHDHYGPLDPTGVSIWLGGDLRFNWDEMMAWLKDEVAALSIPLQGGFSPDRLSFFPGSEQAGRRKLGVVDLNLGQNWYPGEGVVARYVRSSRSKWPSLEVLTLLALNPQMAAAMDGSNIPYMMIAGLVVDKTHLPWIRCGDHHEVVVYECWEGASPWYGTSVVTYRNKK
jgi:hypothetical protein